MKIEIPITINLCHIPDPRTLEAIQALSRQVAVVGDSVMALSTAVQAKIEEIKTVLATVTTQIQTGVSGIQADIQALKDQIAAGGMQEADILAALGEISQSAGQVGVQAQAVADLDLANPVAPPPPNPNDA